MSQFGQHVVVVGGGIAGLSAAWRLQQSPAAAEGSLRITLLEADSVFGGKLRTERVDGLTIEAGPDSFLSYKPAAVRLARELGIEDRIIGTRETGGGTYILRDGRLEPLPEGITMMVPTKVRPLLQSRLLSTRAKLRMAAEYLVPPRTDEGDESVGSFISRRLGREAYERMAQPLLSGIFAGDADRLSLASTFPRLRDIERKHGSLVKGMLAQRTSPAKTAPNGQSPSLPPFVSFAGGMGELSDRLAAALERVNLRSGAAVEEINRADSTYQVRLRSGETLSADVVLLATPAHVTAGLVRLLDGELSAVLRRIQYVSTSTISLAFKRSEIDSLQAGRGFVIPQVENRELTAVTWASNKFAGRAPDDLALLRTFVGRAGRQDAVDLDDQALLRLVRRELGEILGISAEPVVSRIFRWRNAMPQYNLGHQERLAKVESLLTRHPGLELLGAAYRGVGIPDCIDSGLAAADRVIVRLEPGQNST